MNRRFASFAVACLFSTLIPASAFSQAKPASTTTTPPPAPAKWVPPMKGDATLDYTLAKPQKVKGEILTKVRVRNTSKGSIALLAVEEIWYDSKSQIASNGVYRHRAHLNPDQVIDFTIVSPDRPGLYQNMLTFRHANGKIVPKKVSKIE